MVRADARKWDKCLHSTRQKGQEGRGGVGGVGGASSDRLDLCGHNLAD